MPITGSCHCGRTAFRIDAEPPAQLTRCTCSYCAKRGALVAYYPPAQFHAEADSDGIYRWKTRSVTHHFCAACGIAVYADSPAFDHDGSWDGTTRRIGVNARLFDDYDAESKPVQVLDGKHLW